VFADISNIYVLLYKLKTVWQQPEVCRKQRHLTTIGT